MLHNFALYLCLIMSLITKRLKLADQLGFLVSAVCLIHCMITPFIVVLLGNSIKPHHSFISFHFLFLILALTAVLFVSFKSPNIIKIGLWLSIILMGIGTIYEHQHLLFRVLLYAGSIGLIISHFFNMRTKRHN